MRKLIGISALAVALFVGAPVAQAQCLLCGVIGYAIGSAGSSDSSNVGVPKDGMVLYVAPRISERVSNPLDVRIAASQRAGFSNYKYWKLSMWGSSIQQIFNASVENPQDYSILEVMRVLIPDQNDAAIFWFAYIERDKLLPLEKLSTPSTGR